MGGKDKQRMKYLGSSKEDTKFEQMMEQMMEQMIEQMMEWEVNIVCLAETCVVWNMPIAKKVINMVTKNLMKMCAGPLRLQ